MQRPSHDLSYEECVAWMRDLHYVENGKPDWVRFLRDAEVGTDKDMIKSRWLDDKSRPTRAKLRIALDRAEMKRKERTKTGDLIQRLEQWNEIGRLLAKRPDLLARALEQIAPVAESIRMDETARDLSARAAELQAEAFGSPTPKPRGTRK